MRHVLALLLALQCLTAALAQERRSGFDDMARETQAMQREDAANPAMLWVDEGAAIWSRPAGAQGLSCANCHGAAEASMAGIAARYPAWDEGRFTAIDLAGRIAQCREQRQHAPALARESEGLLALAAFIGLQSRAMPLAPPADGRLQATRAWGEALYRQRRGQLDLSCAQCHDRLTGQRLAGSTIPQAHPNGYPLYRLEWQGMGSLYRRLRNCLTGVRAEPFPPDSPEVVALSLYLAWRANGLKVETPAVRP